MKENRKTTIPLKTIPAIVEWLLNNCTKEEIEFMANLAQDRSRFPIFNSILTRLTTYNVEHMFYDSVQNEKDLFVRWASKRGEVAGLKAFSMACQAAVIHQKEKRVKKNESK